MPPGSRRFGGRRSMRDTLAGNNAAQRFYAAMAGIDPPAELLNSIKPKRTAAPRDPSKVYEKDVLADVLQALRADPRVALVMRQQSGVFVEGNRHIRVGSRGLLDIGGMLIGGRHFEIECKRPGERPDERQAERIAAIRRNGGIAGYATSAAEALALLP